MWLTDWYRSGSACALPLVLLGGGAEGRVWVTKPVFIWIGGGYGAASATP